MMAARVAGNGRVTIVIPTYNRAALLPRAIESVLAQTAAKRCDIVVVDDGSTDDTPRVAARFAERILYFRQRNAGVSAARNAGILARPNEFFAFLDSDDVWAPEKTARQLRAMRRHPEVALVTGRTSRRYGDGRTCPDDAPPVPMDRPVDFAPALFDDSFLPTPAVMVRGAHLARSGLFDTSLPIAEDYHLWVRLACRGPGLYLDAPVATYAMGTALSLSDRTRLSLVSQLQARYRLRSELARRSDCRANWRRSVARCLAMLRDHAWREGRYAAAARYGFRSLMLNPLRRRWEWFRCADSLARAVVWGERANVNASTSGGDSVQREGRGSPASGDLLAVAEDVVRAPLPA